MYSTPDRKSILGFHRRPITRRALRRLAQQLTAETIERLPGTVPVGLTPANNFRGPCLEGDDLTPLVLTPQTQRALKALAKRVASPKRAIDPGLDGGPETLA